MEPRLLPLSTATPVNGSSSAPQTRAWPDPYFAMTESSDVKDSYNTVVWVERQGSDIRSHVRAIFQTASGKPVLLAASAVSSLNYRESRPKDFREVAIPCRMNTYLPQRDSVIKAMHFASRQVGAGPFLQNSVSEEREWLE